MVKGGAGGGVIKKVFSGCLRAIWSPQRPIFAALRYQLVAIATYLRLRLRYQLVALATYLRCATVHQASVTASLRYQLVDMSTYLAKPRFKDSAQPEQAKSEPESQTETGPSQT